MTASGARERRRTDLLMQAAVGLTAMYFPTGAVNGVQHCTGLDYVVYVLDGHLETWDRWPRLPPSQGLRFARLLAHRPNQLADAMSAKPLLRAAVLDAAAYWCEPGPDFEENGTIVVHSGMALPQFVDDALRRLDLMEQDADRCTSPAKPGIHRALIHADRARSADLSERTFVVHEYNLLNHHIPATVAPPVLLDAPARDELFAPFEELRRIAVILDRAYGTTYRSESVDRFAAMVKDRDGAAVAGLALESGPLNGLSAFTGFGKSVVLTEAFACWAVCSGVTVGFVLPNNTDVVAATRTITAALGHLRADAAFASEHGDALTQPSVVPLMSPDSLIDVASKTAAADGEGAADEIWAALGYGCALAATVGEPGVDAWRPGREPCRKLKQPRLGKRDLTFACPWRTTCGKFRLARAAVQADVIITSHANLLMGKVGAPMDDGLGVTDRITVEQLLLRRCQVLVVDELDEFQKTALDRAGRGLLLDSGGHVDTTLRTFDTEFGSAFGQLLPEVDESVRDSLFMLRYHSENYVSHLSYERLGEASTNPKKFGGRLSRYWRVPRRWDTWLTAMLFGLDEKDPVPAAWIKMFQSLFLRDTGPQDGVSGEPAVFKEIRRLMHAVVTAGPGGLRVDAARAQLDKLLTPEPPQGPEDPGDSHSEPAPAEAGSEDFGSEEAAGGPEQAGKTSGEQTQAEPRVKVDDAERPKVINRMLSRAILEQIRRNLHVLTANSGQLVDAGVQTAEEIAEALGGYTRWQAAPTGPLNRLVFAFREYRDPSGQTPFQLSAAAFGGDPHSYLVHLGDITALALARCRRIVLGMSATAYFPLAPHHHVFTEPRWWVADDTPDAVLVLAAGVQDENRAWHKISGKTGPNRLQAARSLMQNLSDRLQAELQLLKERDPDRETVLLATTSYALAQAVAEGLLSAGVAAGDICLAVRPGDPRLSSAVATADGQVLHLLAADRLARFPATGARILIAPLARVQRGVNIIGRGDRSALGSIWLIVRPIPLIDEPAELVAHIQSLAHQRHAAPKAEPWDVLHERRKTAGALLDCIVKRPPFFRSQPREVQLGVTAEIVNGAIQLIGRARRGGTKAVLHLVDGAFLDDEAGVDFASLIRDLRKQWHDMNVLGEMERYHGTALKAFFDYADRPLTGEPPC